MLKHYCGTTEKILIAAAVSLSACEDSTGVADVAQPETQPNAELQMSENGHESSNYNMFGFKFFFMEN